MQLLELLRTQPVLALFLILGIGYLIGKIRIGSFAFGPVAGVLFAGLFFGNFGFRISPGAQSVGFALFIFSVGYQAGPRFFDVLRTDGLKYFLLAFVIALSGFAVAAGGAMLLGLKPGSAAGLLAGGLTSSPTLAAAQQAITDGTVSTPAGWSKDQVIGNISTSYAITYIFGLAGLIAIIKLLPGILGINLAQRARELEAADVKQGSEGPVNVAVRVIRVTNEAVTREPLRALREKYPDDFFGAGRLRRGGELISLEPDQLLQLGDEFVVWGDIGDFTGPLKEVGEEVAPTFDLARYSQTARVVVSSAAVVGKTLAELDMQRTYGLMLQGIRRMRLPVPRSSSLRLRKGDILTVVGPQDHIDQLGQALGAIDQDIVETDMLTFAIGIAVGVLIGMLSVEVGGVSVGLGSAGGLVVAGIVVGFMHNIKPTFGRLPDAARWFLMEFGLLVFMTGVGLRAGGDIVKTFLSAGPTLILAGICVTLVPVLVGYVFGRKALKIDPVLLLGAITGAMTSGASLSIVTNESKSAYPSLGYAGTYAFANILLTVAGSLILLL